MKWCSFFFAICIGAAVFADVGPDMRGALIDVHHAGIICAPPTSGIAPAPDTVAGTTHLIDVEPAFISLNRRVPAVLGIAFGVKAQSSVIGGLDDVTMTVTHPAMGTFGATSQSYQTAISGTYPSLTFYQFDFDYELLTGIWQMQASRGSQILYRTTFEVVPPAQVLELASVCGFEELLSHQNLNPVVIPRV